MYFIVWLISLLPFARGLSGMQGVLSTTIMFILVGLSHFLKPEKLIAMIPQSWPYRAEMNYVSGAAEILLGVALIFPSLRSYAALGLIVLLLAVFPANIYVAIHKPGIYTVSRLLFQPVYIAWIYWFCIAGRNLSDLV